MRRSARASPRTDSVTGGYRRLTHLRLVTAHAHDVLLVRIGQEIDTFEGGWTKNRHFMGVRTLPEALLSINKRGPVYVHKNSF